MTEENKKINIKKFLKPHIGEDNNIPTNTFIKYDKKLIEKMKEIIKKNIKITEDYAKRTR